mgnify:CR=1 FL=1
MRISNRLFRRGALAIAAVALLAGCDDGDDGSPSAPAGSERPLQCEADTYAAFDAVNYQNQVLRVAAHAEIATALSAATAEPFDAATSNAAFAAARATYVDTASLQEKVQGRLDDHLVGQPATGAALDATLMAWFEVGATTDDPLAATVARQWIEKTLIDFFFLSVHHELVDGAASHWDEAFGYLGAPVDNAEGARRGLALVATKRDATNGTALEATLYNGMIDGGCALAEALAAAGTDSVAWDTVPALKVIVDELDLEMQKTLAFSVAHEAFEMAEVQEMLAANPDDADAQAEMWIKLSELDPYFRPIERLMTAKGGASATRAGEIRAMLDIAWGAWEARDSAWMIAVDAAGIVERIEAEYAIDVKG